MKRSGIITLLTDFGITDPYVAMMKGVILSINPDARIVDISHHISAGSILQASSFIHETFSFFPDGTVHVVVVDPGVGSNRRLIGLDAGGHLFVGPDNGTFWPLVEDYKEAKIIHLTENRYFLPHITQTFHGREVFAPVAAYLSSGEDLERMGRTIKDPERLSAPIPHKMDNILYGQVIRVDNFGNLITNIRNEDLERFLKKSKPIIYIGNLELKKIENIYSDTEKGEPLALINSSDLLEIAINLGRASEYIGICSDEIMGTAVKVGRYE
ncbi:S-adenosyl-l-methionine hydroxide adenosyltransferase family protein [Thermodesulfobacteriota bacterium]